MRRLRSGFFLYCVRSAAPTPISVICHSLLKIGLRIILARGRRITADTRTHSVTTEPVTAEPAATPASASLGPTDLSKAGKERTLPAATDSLATGLDEEAHEHLN